MSGEISEFSIDLQQVTRRFGSQVAVNELTLRITRGSVFGFIGLNGAGKTTAIRMMVGLLKPHAGSIHIDGIEVPENRDAVKSHVGYVPDRPNVYPWMRVGQAIAFAKSFHKHWNEPRCDELLKMFELDVNKRVKHLSKGQAAKLSLLLAICHDPKVLFLDEPMSGLDPLVHDEFLEGILAATAEGQTVLLSSHTLADVQRLSDSVGLLHEGKLLFHSSIDALLDATKRIRIVLEEEGASRQPPPGVVWQETRGRQWTITVSDFKPDCVEFIRSRNHVSTLEVQDLSLDDVFKDFVKGKKEAVCSR